MLRGRSKDGVRKSTPPGPVYMSNDQFTEYLKDLRSNRVARPTGARPQPTSTSYRHELGEPIRTNPQANWTIQKPLLPTSRSDSVQSHRRTDSALSTNSVASSTGRQLIPQPNANKNESVRTLKASDVVPSATYMERGQRWMEKEDAVSLREALEDMDLQKQGEEEVRVHAAAQDEASELVFQHQNPILTMEKDAPYRYRSHLKKNSYQQARSASIGRHSRTTATGRMRDPNARTVSSESKSSYESHAQRSRISSSSSDNNSCSQRPNQIIDGRISVENEKRTRPQTTSKPYGSISKRTSSGSRRRNSAKRNVSGEIGTVFTVEQIWEEAGESNTERGRSRPDQDVPEPLRIKSRNPLHRVQFAQGLSLGSTPLEAVKKLSSFEIHRNPPSQSRNPNYTATLPITRQKIEGHSVEDSQPQVKDGIEIRSEEIRQATSMRMKDRSPKLPTPTVVSDRPGRPIVSFDKYWASKEADKTAGARNTLTLGHSSTNKPNPAFTASKTFEDADRSPVKTKLPEVLSVRLNHVEPTQLSQVNLTESTSQPPRINFPNSERPIPSISVFDIPDIAITTPDQSQASKRPLPDPKTIVGQSRPARPSNHPGPFAGNRATATCHQCQLPIEGRVVRLRGSPENFHPQCFICFSCGTGLESLEIRPEPELSRMERLSRIKRRSQGEQLPEIEGQTYAEDGDERLRHFCHLDWHENFAPRCRHCKTPIMEEHMIALGHHWHYGHFFCAECGDPFEKGVSHIEKDGYAWCINCQTKRTERRAPKCKKCKEPVIGEYVEALGGEWHDRCFRCASCHGGFDDGSFYPKDVGDETLVLCTRCIELELKA